MQVQRSCADGEREPGRSTGHVHHAGAHDERIERRIQEHGRLRCEHRAVVDDELAGAGGGLLEEDGSGSAVDAGPAAAREDRSGERRGRVFDCDATAAAAGGLVAVVVGVVATDCMNRAGTAQRADT
jgi:hypothetical protein